MGIIFKTLGWMSSCWDKQEGGPNSTASLPGPGMAAWILDRRRCWGRGRGLSAATFLVALVGFRASLVVQMVKNLPAMGETWVRSWVGEIPWRREWLPTRVFLPGESHGQRSLGGHSPQHSKESDTTERLSLFTSLLVGFQPPDPHEETPGYHCARRAALKLHCENQTGGDA